MPTKADGSPYLDAQNEIHPLDLPSSSVDTTTSQLELIVFDNSAPCSPVNNPRTGGRLKRRGGKQRRGVTTNPESGCSSPAVTTPADTAFQNRRAAALDRGEAKSKDPAHMMDRQNQKSSTGQTCSKSKLKTGIIRPVLRLRMGWCRSAYAKIQRYNLSRLGGTFSWKSTVISALEHGGYPILNSVRFYYSSGSFFITNRD